MNQQPLYLLLDDIPPNVLQATLDSVMIDYAIASLHDIQTQSPEEAAGNIRILKRLRDALFLTSQASGVSL
jgi:hypothetical protein